MTIRFESGGGVDLGNSQQASVKRTKKKISTCVIKVLSETMFTYLSPNSAYYFISSRGTEDIRQLYPFFLDFH